MPSLTAPHERALTLLFSELADAAARQSEAFLGSPGSLTERTNETGTRYWVHRYSDAAGRRQETYLGKSDDTAVIARVAEHRERIAAADSAIAGVRLLARTEQIREIGQPFGVSRELWNAHRQIPLVRRGNEEIDAQA